MEKIRYLPNMVFIFDDEKQMIRPVDISERIKLSDYIFVYTAYDNFMRYNPPCNKCLICSMCIKEQVSNSHARYTTDTYLYIKVCDKLKSFVNDNKLFYIEGWDK